MHRFLGQKIHYVGSAFLIAFLAILHFYPFDLASFKFIQYDDEMFILPMFNVGLSKYWSQWFPSPYTYAYPLRDMTFFFDQWLSGLVGLQTYHYTSFVFYGLTIGLFARLLTLFFPKRPWLICIALLLTFLHPLNVEIVQWVSARKNLMPPLFVMLGQLIVFRAWFDKRMLRPSEWGWLWGLQLASLACYPSSSLWLLWVIALQWGRLSKRKFGLHLGAAAFVLWAYLRWTARGESDFAQSFGVIWSDPSRVGYYLVRSLGRGFYNLLLPHRLSMFYAPESLYNHIGFGLLLGYLALLAYLFRRVQVPFARRTLVALAALIVALLLPQAHVFLSFTDFRWADRYAYIVLPYVVVFNIYLLEASGVLTGWQGAGGFQQRAVLRRLLGLLFLGGVLGYFCLLSRQRIPLWRDAIMLQEDCAQVEGAPKCVITMISSTFMEDCGKASQYIAVGFEHYVAYRQPFNDQLTSELPFYDATCVALRASLRPAEKTAFIPQLFDKYPGSPGPVFALTLAYIEAGQLDAAWSLAQTYYLSGQPGSLGASKLLLQIYFGHTAALCEILGKDECWQRRSVLVQSNPLIPEKSPSVNWGYGITRFMQERAVAAPH